MDKNFRVLNLDIRYDDIDLTNKPWKPTLYYVVFGLLWILFSDNILSFFVKDMELYSQIQMYKGWFYVLLTGVVLYFLIKADNKKIYNLTKQIARKNEELVTFSEELVAMEEDLEKKLAKLNVLTKEIKEQKDFIEEIYNSSNMVIMVWKPTGEIVDCNTYFRDLMSLETCPVGHKWAELLKVSANDLDIQNMIDRIITNQKASDIETEITTSDGRVLHMIWNMSYILDPVTKEYVIASYGANITGERQKERRLLEVATTDPLTNLKNRAAYESEIQSWIEEKEAFTLYLIGLDNFKHLNDLYGHLYGDILLEQLGNKLTRCFDSCLIYRWSGDEFLIIDTHSSVEDVNEMIKNIMHITKQKWSIRDIEYSSSASLGIVRYPFNGVTTTNLASNLDIALSHAKRKGKGAYQFFTDTFIESLRYESDMENALHDAITKDKLTLNFQPIVNMHTNEIVSLEALLRWPNNPLNEGNIGKVISLAEKSGQIIMIDKWVINHVFHILKTNASMFKDTKVSINLSVQSFHSKNFARYLKTKIEEHDIEPSQVELEITEYSLAEDIEKSSEIIREIKDLGFKIALDDFGTKYSSLNYLSKLPFDVLKVDKSYIDHIVSDEKDRVIVNNLVRLSADLNLTTIIEGIEIKEQKDLLIGMGCQLGQGYLYYKPMPIEVLQSKMDNQVQEIS